MERNLEMMFVRVTEVAAIASARFIGRGNEKEADQAAVDVMRKAFDTLHIDGTIVIGEGERDEAPMLYIGEKVGNKNGPKLDIALDPLEGTTITARGDYNASSVLAVADAGNFLHAPDTYMYKLAVGPLAKGKVSIQDPIDVTLRNLSKALNKPLEDVTVCILDRDRHQNIISTVRSLGCRIRLIRDGDVSAALATCMPDANVDILLGSGGAPEGVISAAALKCLGGDFQGKLEFRTPQERERAISMGLKNPDNFLMTEDLAKGDVIFCATGVTTGEMIKGVQFTATTAVTHSIVMCSKTRAVSFIETKHALVK